ncbi:MAG: hypothetical protein K2K15_04735 [Anaeroplasmataceae bacterium]|nr:hypothetical protein [Anaeroplasmataceae bacterium]
MEKIKCPLCNSKKIRGYKKGINYVDDCLFECEKKVYFCCHCGNAFKEENLHEKSSATKISSAEFFDIIFTAMKDILGKDKLPIVIQDGIKKTYEKRVKIYLKEVALMYALVLYEMDIKEQESFFVTP